MHIKKLVIDQYGNYVIQHVIEHTTDADRDRIIEEISVNSVIHLFNFF